MKILSILTTTLVCFAIVCLGCAQPRTFSVPKPAGALRVMTYNMEWFSEDANPKRISNVREILADIKPDIIGIQEIQSERAARQFLDSEWTVGLVKENIEFQNLAIAVRAPYQLVSYDYVFKDRGLEFAFPGNRDVLRAEIKSPGGQNITAYVIHAKSRRGGRLQTDSQREMASALLAGYISRRGDRNVVLMGDFNDAPNDTSAAILASGDVTIKGGARPPFRLLANLTFDLWEKDMVTIGLHEKYFGEESALSASVPNAKSENDRLRGIEYRFPQDVSVTQIMFDQIFVSPHLGQAGSRASVYTGPAALRGLRGRVTVTNNPDGSRNVVYTEKGTMASDHLPVYADILGLR
ncbi:MAG: endonuclease/exonuclease/phosphatase family protein [Fimbriimonadaceae bacterium]|jgi:endonuclease/exonuclease/phosphatase family metal-dependent hydrolase|nr:endonuclease/exonuclease/phosphatase family protein [Fimbriimonadaceae bacterium]